MQREFDINRIRADFPILSEKLDGKPLAYFDNAATAQKPQAVIDAISDYFQHSNANVHRGAHTLGDRATRALEHAREVVRAFINAGNSKEIIWTRGTTEAINLVAHGLAASLQKGDEILLSRLEHHANIVPWQMAAQRSGAIIKVIELNEKGELLEGAFEALLNEKTKVLAITHVSNVLGTINPVKQMIAKAQEVGAITVIDGAQAVPHIEVDVIDLDCDFYAFSSHKLYGPTGIGVLYGKEDRLNALPPYQGGGEMIEQVTFEKTTYAGLPYKFEAGTPPISEAVALAAAIDYLQAFDRQELEAAEGNLLSIAKVLSKGVPGMRLIGTATQKVAVMSFLIDGLHPSDIGTLLNQQGMAIRTGNHCAMPLMEFFETAGTARASFAFYNTQDEVENLFKALAKIQKLFAE